jgi:hypothetical protein
MMAEYMSSPGGEETGEGERKNKFISERPPSPRPSPQGEGEPFAAFFRVQSVARNPRTFWQNESVEIGSPRQAFVAKLRAQCESLPSIMEPSASASR